jgi:hypothetical protein
MYRLCSSLESDTAKEKNGREEKRRELEGAERVK